MLSSNEKLRPFTYRYYHHIQSTDNLPLLTLCVNWPVSSGEESVVKSSWRWHRRVWGEHSPGPSSGGVSHGWTLWCAATPRSLYHLPRRADLARPARLVPPILFHHVSQFDYELALFVFLTWFERVLLEKENNYLINLQLSISSQTLYNSLLGLFFTINSHFKEIKCE